MIKEIARQKSATKSKLTYMDPPLSPRRPEPAEKRPAEKKAEFVIPEAAATILMDYRLSAAKH